MNKKKRTSLAKLFLLSLLLVCLLIPIAHADMGPKEALYITVVNAPEGETLYIDLLAEGAPVGEGNGFFDNSGYDEDILAQLRSLEGDGWVLAFSTGLSGKAPIFGDVAPQSDGTYYFGYYGLPQTFRLAAATGSQAQAMSQPFTRTRFYTNLVYDWEANTLTYATPNLLYWAVQLAATLIPTLIIEGLVFFLFGFRTGRSWVVFLCVNVVTQIGLHLVCAAMNISVMETAFFWLFYLFLLVPELVIWGVEAAAYALLLPEHSRGRRVGYAFAANILSFALSYLPLNLLYWPMSRL